MVLLKKTIIGAAKTTTMVVVSMIPHAFVSYFFPSTAGSTVVYLFLILEQATRDAQQRAADNEVTQDGVVPEPRMIPLERILTGVCGSMVWLAVETACTGAFFSMVFAPFLAYLFVQTLVNGVYLIILASMEGTTYRAYMTLVLDFARSLVGHIEAACMLADKKDE